ncbi:hypothetical protein [Planctomycetes bacterium CA13]
MAYKIKAYQIVTAFLLSIFVACNMGLAQEPSNANPKTLHVLFIGNSYTARHNLAQVVKAMSEAANAELSFLPTQVIYGGQTLKAHWRLGTQHIINRHCVNREQVAATIAELKTASEEDPTFKHASGGLTRMRSLLQEIENGTLDRTKWDLVVLQSYRDDLQGAQSSYMRFAPKFAELAKAQDARVLLYETTPSTQNQFPITQHQEPSAVLEKARQIAKLATQIDASVAPMSYVALQCQTSNPQVTLRFENDPHLNQTMAYLTACTIYAAIYDRSPEGVAIDSVTDIRFLNNDRDSGKDRDGKPIKKVFSKQEQAFLQTTAWRALQEFKKKFQPQ